MIKVPRLDDLEEVLAIKPHSKLGIHQNIRKDMSIQEQKLYGGTAIQLDKGDGFDNGMSHEYLHSLEK